VKRARGDSFYSVRGSGSCLVSLVFFSDFCILFRRLVLVSDPYTAVPLSVRE